MAHRFIRFPEGKTKALTLSYDDAVAANKKFEEIITQYGIKCTFNINTSRLVDNKDLTAQDLKGFLQRGHEIAVHGHNHRANGLVSTTEGIRDVLTCREELERALDTIVCGMAYPDCGIRRFNNGTMYQDIKNYLSALGIVYSRTLAGDNDGFKLPLDWHAWMPTAHHANKNLFEYIDKFLAFDPDDVHYHTDHNVYLFYLWGHAYEFERSDYGWELLEKICSKLSGRKEVWYATNMEIYEYVKAYDSLVFNTGETKVYNPSAKTVWFAISDSKQSKTYRVNSGETIDII